MDGVFAFDQFRLFPTSRILHRDGAAIQMGSRAFDMLVALVQSGGQVLSQRELMAIAWPGVFVEESNVRVQMAALRRELGGPANTTRHIVSIPGRGYCFVTPVQWFENDAQADIASQLERSDGTDDRISRSQDASRDSLTKLPSALDRVYGRDDDVRMLEHLLSDRRFVTIVGGGGAGKTTLAILVAHHVETFPDTYFIDLSSVSDGSAVLETIGETLGVSSSGDTFEALVDFLGGRQVLLVLDNCEHVADSAANAADSILRRTVAVHVLATSREALRLRGEAVYLIRPLGAPRSTELTTAAEALDWPAVALFMERAAEGGYDQPLSDQEAPMVAEVCRSLDGNPLAIELVATRTATYGLSKLLDLLSDQLVLRWKYRRDAAPRHQSVEAMLDWSYDLLTPSEQSVLQRLSVFVGDFSLEAAAAVGGDESTPSYEVSDAIGSLVDKSLINLQAVPGSALLRLRDTTKTYAAMKLHDSGQATDARRRHAEYYLRHLQQYPIEAEATLGNNRGARVNLNLPNVRAALEWAFSLVGDKRLAVEMCTLAVPALADMVSSARIRTAIKNNTDMTKYRI